jgi:hypothetical protein
MLFGMDPCSIRIELGISFPKVVVRDLVPVVAQMLDI